MSPSQDLAAVIAEMRAAARRDSHAAKQLTTFADRLALLLAEAPRSSKVQVQETKEDTRVADTTLVHGYDAQFWYDSYRLVSEAVLEHLSPFVHDDDVAEEAIFVDAIEKAGAVLAALPETSAIPQHQDLEKKDDDQKDARMAGLSTSSDASRTAAPDEAEGARPTTPGQVSNVLRELDSYRRAMREAFDEGYAARGRRSPIEHAWEQSEARQAEWGFAHTRMSVGALARPSAAEADIERVRNLGRQFSGAASILQRTEYRWTDIERQQFNRLCEWAKEAFDVSDRLELGRATSDGGKQAGRGLRGFSRAPYCKC